MIVLVIYTSYFLPKLAKNRFKFLYPPKKNDLKILIFGDKNLALSMTHEVTAFLFIDLANQPIIPLGHTISDKR